MFNTTKFATLFAVLTAHNASAGSFTQTEPLAVPTIIRNVQVFHPDGAVSGPHDVTLSDGDISGVFPYDPNREFSGAAVDGGGHTLIPGLIDTHVHLNAPNSMRGEWALPRPHQALDKMLFSGVTTVVDLGTPIEVVKKIRKKSSRNGHAGPKIYASGKPYTAHGGHPIALSATLFPPTLQRFIAPSLGWEVSSRDEVDYAFVDNARTDFVKLMLDNAPGHAPMLGTQTLAWITQNAKVTKQPIVAHVHNAKAFETALDLGVAALGHAPYLGTIEDHHISTLIASKTPMIATVAVWDTLVQVHTQRPHLSTLDTTLISNRASRHAAALISDGDLLPKTLDAWLDTIANNRTNAHETVRRVHAAGGQILVGTDSPGLGLVPGGAYHRELQALNVLGIPARDLLISATWRNSRFIDADAHFGAVIVGYDADLLLIGGDPTTYIDDLINIKMMWLDGRQVKRVVTANQE
jgi:enamidase